MMRTVKTSTTPSAAPAEFRSLPAKLVISDGQGLFERWHGSGVAIDEACGECGNQAGNLQIFGNWGYSYPNGNSWDDREIVCARCGWFTYICKFVEG